jgi:hypothetical protein
MEERMRRDEVLAGFNELSSEDRRAVEAEIIRTMAFEGAPGMGSAMAATIEIMDRIRTGGDPVAVCREMLDEMAGTCCQ